jgi:hypothetical protein
VVLEKQEEILRNTSRTRNPIDIDLQENQLEEEKKTRSLNEDLFETDINRPDYNLEA